MSAVKTLALGILAWAAWTTVSLADPVSFGGADFNWTNFDVTTTGSANLISNAPSVSAPAPAPTPAPAPAPAPTPAPTENSTLTAASSSPSPAASASPTLPAGTTGMVDAYLNFGSGPYPEASYLTTGGAQAWYQSRGVDQLFGGVPNAQQQQSFINTVAQRVEETFQLSGVPLTLTTSPNVSAAHTLSIVSGTGSAITNGAIGETDIGRNGFSFIDQIAQSAQNVDQLEWIVAHNVSHELMLAFGVPEINDQTGTYIDSTKANLAMMVSPTATFSPGAAQDLLAQNFLNAVPMTSAEPQLIGPQAVPEPATVALWGFVLAGAAFAHRRAARRPAA